MEPLVSIITPAFNASRYLVSFFESVLNQDYSNYELIFINDGSTDDTAQIALRYKKSFEEKGHRFVYLAKENGGQAAALNTGFPYMKGKYFIWPDSDDTLCSDNLSAKVDFMEENPSIDLGIAWAKHVDENGSDLGILKRIPVENDDLFRDLLVSNNVQFCPGIYIIRTSTFKKCYPNLHIDESRAGQNYQLLLPIAYRYNYAYINKVLYTYILHPTSHSNSKQHDEQAQLERFERQERLLLRLIDHICIQDDKAEMSTLVRRHFQGIYLRIANEHIDRRKAAGSIYSLCRMRCVSYKDIIYAFATFVGIKLK